MKMAMMRLGLLAGMLMLFVALVACGGAAEDRSMNESMGLQGPPRIARFTGIYGEYRGTC